MKGSTDIKSDLHQRPEVQTSALALKTFTARPGRTRAPESTRTVSQSFKGLRMTNKKL